jgi:hypothetical protein
MHGAIRKMSDARPEPPRLPIDTSVDIWKFFEERGDELKKSMFAVVTWIIGFAAVLLGFVVSEGFEKGLTQITHPPMVIGLCIAGLCVLYLAYKVILDNAAHLNRTFARANAARDGETSPKKIWDAGKRVEGDPLPGICGELRTLVLFMMAVFVIMIAGAIYTLFV